jgi:regulatory protein
MKLLPARGYLYPLRRWEPGVFSFSFATMNKKQLTPEQALQKLKHYCAYQERSHNEVREKLYSLGVWKKDHDHIIANLIEQDYLNEERFAIAFAGGKFRIKQWGRVKIKHELKQKGVGEYSIKKAMKQISEEDYWAVLKKLADEKYMSLKSEQYLIRKKKTMDYLVQRGFEIELIKKAIDAE